MRRTAVLTAVSVMVLSAGCSGDQEPDADVTPIIPTETASSAVATPTQEPEAESAEEFVRRWQAVADKAQTTGDPATLRAFFKNCPPCSDVVNNIKDVYATGGRLEGVSTRVTNVRVTSRRPMLVRATVTSQPMQLVLASGERESYPGGPQVLEFSLTGEPGAWLLRGFSVIPS